VVRPQQARRDRSRCPPDLGVQLGAVRRAGDGRAAVVADLQHHRAANFALPRSGRTRGRSCPICDSIARVFIFAGLADMSLLARLAETALIERRERAAALTAMSIAHRVVRAAHRAIPCVLSRASATRFGAGQRQAAAAIGAVVREPPFSLRQYVPWPPRPSGKKARSASSASRSSGVTLRTAGPSQDASRRALQRAPAPRRPRTTQPDRRRDFRGSRLPPPGKCGRLPPDTRTHAQPRPRRESRRAPGHQRRMLCRCEDACALSPRVNVADDEARAPRHQTDAKGAATVDVLAARAPTRALHAAPTLPRTLASKRAKSPGASATTGQQCEPTSSKACSSDAAMPSTVLQRLQITALMR
jgi:hypothetical protein